MDIGQQLKQTTAFRYLGSWQQESGDFNREIQARLQGTGNTCRDVSGIIYDKRMGIRLKIQVYKTMVRPVIIYGTETWAVKEEHVKKLEVAEMRCLRAIISVTRRERMRNATSFPGLSCEDEGRDEKALVWAGQFCILIG